MQQIPKLKCFSSRLAAVFVQSTEARFEVDNRNENVVGAALSNNIWVINNGITY